jgi:LemA protein
MPRRRGPLQRSGRFRTAFAKKMRGDPQLKYDPNFLSLQSQLEGTKNRIAVARPDNIEAVQRYNRMLLTISSRWIAAWLYPDAKVRETFSVFEQAQQTPQVKF